MGVVTQNEDCTCLWCVDYSDVIDNVTSLYDVILVKPQSSKTSHSEPRTWIDYPCGQTLPSVSVGTVGRITYIVLAQTLNHAQSITCQSPK